MSSTSKDADSAIILEAGQRLSNSRLWNWQRRYFISQGAAAWQSGDVPHYVTSNTFMADAYAKTVLAFLRDRAAQLDSAQPIYVLELGSGIGRFGFHFLLRFFARLARSPLAGLRVTYVLSDLAPANVDFYQGHPQLLPFFDSGQLDCATFDATRDSELRLRRSGVTLAPGRVHNPLAVIANYFFDGIPADAFSVEGEQLCEQLVTLSAPGPIVDPDAPELLRRVELRCEPRRAALPYYGEASWDRILASYAAQGRAGWLLFPCAALTCLNRLRALTERGLLLLSADKGAHALADVLDQEPAPVLHGSFSLLVNYHTIGEWVRERGGLALHGDHRQGSLSLNAFLLDTEAADETRCAFADVLACGGPDDLFMIKKAIDYRYETLTAEQALALVRLTDYDAKIFCGLIPVLKQALARCAPSSPLHADIMAALAAARASFYAIGERDELAAQLAAFSSVSDGSPVPARVAARGHRFSALRIMPPRAG